MAKYCGCNTLRWASVYEDTMAQGRHETKITQSGFKLRSARMLVGPLDPKHHEGRSPSVFFTLVWPAHSTGPGPKLMLKKCWLNSWRSVFPKPVCILIHYFVSLSKHDPTNHWNVLQLLKIPQIKHSLKNPHSSSTQCNNTQSLKMVSKVAENEAADEGRS